MTSEKVNGAVTPSNEDDVGKSDQVKRGRKRRRESSAKKIKSKSQQEVEEYEVEDILSHAVETDPSINTYYQQVLYLVKWKGWGPESNTWEKFPNLINSLELIVEYYDKLLGQPVLSTSQIAAFKRSILNEITNEDIEITAKEYISPDDVASIPEINIKELDEKMTLVARLPRIARDPKLVKELKREYTLIEVAKRRKEQLINLKEWEKEIQKVCDKEATITVENNVDLDGRPLDFKYIKNCTFMSLHDKVNTTALLGCDCSPCVPNVCSCATRDSSKMGYNTVTHLLKAPKGVAIYECSKICLCPPECPNRVLQRGRQIPLCIFKTSNGCGWGVKTLNEIIKGQFVTEYVGEVITCLESDKRCRRSTKEGRTYLFDLDFNGADCKYTIDAAEYGNVSHFINHSCNPNLEVRAVFVDVIDASLPRLGLFAKKKINPNEEINFDYLCQPMEKYDKRGNTILDPKVKCRCNSKNCRTYLF